MDFAQFELSLEAEDGKWFDQGDGSRIKVRSSNSEAYRKILNKKISQYPNWRGLRRKVREQVMCEAMAEGLLVDWESVTYHGEVMVPNYENRLLMLQQLIPFREYVSTLADSITNFQDGADQD